MTKIDWSGKIRQEILKAIKERGRGGFATVRSVYYYLGSLNFIPMTEQGYKQLDALVVKMRRNQDIPWGYFPVVRGTNGTSPGQYWTVDEHYDTYRDEFLESSKYYHVPLWYKQKNHVEVWVEKKGLLPKVERYVGGLGVQVRAVEGYPPWEFAYESIGEIQTLLEDRAKDANVIILYMGDLDPSGVDIDRQIQEAFEHFEIDITFDRVGLMPEQVDQYNLPQIPNSAETIEKVHRDPRYANYLSNYGERFTELDAWDGISPDTMRMEIRNAVMSFFDHGLDDWRGKLQDKNLEELQEKLDDAKERLEE